MHGLLSAAVLREIDWSWLSLDGAMTKAPLGVEKTGPHPTDRGKGGVKRSLLKDAHGIPLAIVIDGANRHDMKLAKPTLESLEVERPALLVVWPQGLCMDKGYDYRRFSSSQLTWVINRISGRPVRKCSSGKLEGKRAAG